MVCGGMRQYRMNYVRAGTGAWQVAGAVRSSSRYSPVSPIITSSSGNGSARCVTDAFGRHAHRFIDYHHHHRRYVAKRKRRSNIERTSSTPINTRMRACASRAARMRARSTPRNVFSPRASTRARVPARRTEMFCATKCACLNLFLNLPYNTMPFMPPSSPRRAACCCVSRSTESTESPRALQLFFKRAHARMPFSPCARAHARIPQQCFRRHQRQVCACARAVRGRKR